MKQIGGMAVSAVLLVSLMVPALSYAAATPQDASPKASPSAGAEERYKQHGDLRHPKGEPHHERYREARKLEMLKDAAAYFGLRSEGKTAEQLRQEVRAAKEKHPEKWASFKAAQHEKQFLRLKEFAAKQGINVQGKSEEQLKNELRSLQEQGKLKLPPQNS